MAETERPSGEVTLLLRDWQSGDHAAESKLFEILMPDLRRIAAAHFRRERQGHTLQPTALVNEAFLRLAAAKNVEWNDRGHFLALAARIMRRFLIDHSRKCPDAAIVPIADFPDHLVKQRSQLDWAIAIDSLLDAMAENNPRQRSVVELKFYLGMTDSEAAEAMGLTLRSLQREWFLARRWLFERLSAEKVKAGSNALAE